MGSFIEAEQSDPRSVFYKRVLVRPNPRLWIVPLVLLGVVACVLISWFVAGSLLRALVFTLLAVFLLGVCFGRYVLIYMIQLYQRFAPEAVRNRCRYEPSCSQYMILAVQKYGLIKGLYKGLRRWSGCKPPAGGYDMP